MDQNQSKSERRVVRRASEAKVDENQSERKVARRGSEAKMDKSESKSYRKVTR